MIDDGLRMIWMAGFGILVAKSWGSVGGNLAGGLEVDGCWRGRALLARKSF